MIKLAQFMIESSQDTLNMPQGPKSEDRFASWWEEQFEIFTDISETAIAESPPKTEVDRAVGARVIAVCKTIGDKSFAGFCRPAHRIEVYRLFTRQLVEDLIAYVRHAEKQRIMESN